MSVQRRRCQAAVIFREQLHDADLFTAFAEHASRWRHVMSDICFHYGPGFRAPSTTQEPWDVDEADLADDYDADFRAAFRAHMTHWEIVMNELRLIHDPSPTPILCHLHRGPIHHASLFRRRRSVSLRISLARVACADHYCTHSTPLLEHLYPRTFIILLLIIIVIISTIVFFILYLCFFHVLNFASTHIHVLYCILVPTACWHIIFYT